MPTTKKKFVNIAQLIAQSVSVVCPSCGECQPSPDDGSDLWTFEDFQKITKGPRVCCNCDEPIIIVHANKVQFN